MAFSFSKAEFAFVLTDLEFYARRQAKKRVFVVELTIAAWSSIFVISYEFVAIGEGHAASILELTVAETSRVGSIVSEASLSLEKVAGHVLDVAVSSGLILHESALVLRAVQESHFTSASTLVFLPFSFVKLAVSVETGALAMSPVVIVSTFIIAPILQHDFDLTTYRHSPLLKPALDDFVLSRVKNTWTVRLIVPPFTFIQGTTFELAEAATVAHIAFETALVDVTCACIKRSLPTPQIFGQMTLVLVYGLLFNRLKLREAVVDKINVSSVDAVLKSIRYLQRILYLKFRLNIITLLQFDASVCHLNTGILDSIDNIFEIPFLFAIVIRFIKAFKDLHHFVMLFFVDVFGVVHPVYEGGLAVKLSASLRHHLHILIERLILGLIFITVIAAFGARNSRGINIRMPLLN